MNTFLPCVSTRIKVYPIETTQLPQITIIGGTMMMRNATRLTSPLVAPPAAVLRSPCASGRFVVTFALRAVVRDTETGWGMRVWLVEVLSVPLITWNLFNAVRPSARRQQCVVVRAAQVDASAFFRCLRAFLCCMRATSLSPTVICSVQSMRLCMPVPTRGRGSLW